MVTLSEVSSSLLSPPSKTTPPTQSRAPSTYHPLQTFTLPSVRSYKQQYGDMYFLRLTKVKPSVEKRAIEAWDGNVIAGEKVQRVERVLDVRQGELCWMVGTVYIDMALKPNILEDVAKDRWIGAPPTTQRYYSDDDSDQIMLEDESGRIRLVGKALDSLLLVTGCIVSVMGTETSDGELEVIDIKFPELPPQPKRWTLSEAPEETTDDVEMADGTPPPKKSSKIAIVSGLSFSSADASSALQLNMLQEFLLGESLEPEFQKELASISRLIIAGNSIANDGPELDEKEKEKAKKGIKRYGYDASTYNPVPSQLFDSFLADILPSIPVTLLPGLQDPANVAYPQQPIHTAMFPQARQYTVEPGTAGKEEEKKKVNWFDAVSNPFEAEIDGWRVLGTGGQNVDDVFKYVDSDDRLGMMEAMCRWRNVAPTAPDTLYSYPFQNDDPFVLKECPHLFFVGCQPEFHTRVIEGEEGQKVRLITIPEFNKAHEICLVDTETLEVTKVKIAVGLEE